MCPITLPCIERRRHDPRLDVGIDSVNSTRPTRAFGRWHKVQEASCEIGKRFWNSVRNARCSGKETNDLDAKSAMTFNSPATCCVVMGEALQSSIRKASTRKIRAAFVAFVDRRRDAHATVGVLSHQHATCECAKSAILSRTNQCNNKPVISKSEFDIFPVLFASETMSFWISRGNTTRHTSGGSALFKPNHTPPAPSLDASQ